ncbi:hypothetical protein SteCoe_926 [Stentor coeruleus]|uniref:PIPK domain-containing protein n=1 Tax=Stentor coeruleus TaxID=5963 RepID=A0A1R2D388_9CILI|nr:hypothetical protein SteCoe_926 [Stentor coeruleus]
MITTDFGNRSTANLTDLDLQGTRIIIYYLCCISFFTLICIVIYFKKHIVSRSNEIVNLIILTISHITVSIILTTLMFADEFKISENQKIDIATAIDSLYGTLGILQFIILFFRTKFRNRVLKIILKVKKAFRKSFHSTELQSPSVQLIQDPSNTLLIEPRVSSLTLAQGVTFADIFEGLTKNSLIIIFTSLSLIFMNEVPSNCESKKHSFTKRKISVFAKEINLKVIEKISKTQLSIEEFFPSVFSKLRSECSCESIYKSLINPINYYKIINFISEKGGRSGSFVFSTFDEKFIIKTISKVEAKLFLYKLLNSYIERIKVCPQSRLTRIFGIFRVFPLKQFVIIMENVLYNKEKSYIFDLKGSKVDRVVKFSDETQIPPKGVILKDMNLIQLGYKLVFSKEKAELLMKILFDDFNILKEAGIMDYSILLGVCDDFIDNEMLNRYSEKTLTKEIVSIGIIDLFQEYNLSKVSETAVKSVFNKKEDISSTNPQDYYERICKFVFSIFTSSN